MTEKTLPIFSFILSILSFIINCSILNTVIYGIPHTIPFTLACYYVYSINIWQVEYFYIICYYVKVKLKQFNQIISNKLKSKKKINRRFNQSIISSLNSLYFKINAYNTNFWSKYLLSIWLILGSVIIDSLYFIIFVPMNII